MTNFHLLIDAATQWTDRHFIDPSLTTAARASGAKREIFHFSVGGCAYFSYKSSKSLWPSQCVSAPRQNQLTFHADFFLFSHVITLGTQTQVVSSHTPSFTHSQTDTQKDAKQPFDDSGKQYDGTL